MISHDYKTIFVHIPKTGGSSIESVLWPKPRKESDLWAGWIDEYSCKYQTGGLQHLKYKHIVKEVPDYLHYFKFTFVRNPYDRIVSNWMTFKREKTLQNYLRLESSTRLVDFINASQKKIHVHWDLQSSFISHELDFVGRFENYNEDFKKVMNTLGIEINEIPHYTKSNRREYDYYHTPRTKDLIYNFYKDDFEMLGYDKTM